MAHHRSGVTSLPSSSIPSGPNTNSSSSSSAPVLYPQLESQIAPLDSGDHGHGVIKIEKALVAILRQANPLEDVGDLTILPDELLADSRKRVKPKVDPLERLKELPGEEAEAEDEEAEDEEDEDEEAAVVEDEEDDAGGDYLVSHFDNGEGYEDNDDEGDDQQAF